ncbi:MAG: tRNA (N(6)-L-threonylcarbamoyladenosine(37)-C(2))-methylthiotransferase MtaB [Ruminococcaceae bacterium]|nr:tRNA (N(6)-L-threonylcarbamoyladenosine(37)-C(2))-methylthiotransferase MtaB [Oscillospiraceae bacterium]
MDKTVAICTLGCKVNQYESEAVLEQFIRLGYQVVDFSEAASVYVVNTCTVTHLSDRKSRQMIRRAKQQNPHSVLIVMGCYAQIEPDAVAAIPGVDLVLGTAERSRAAAMAESLMEAAGPLNLVAETACDFEPLTIDGSAQEHTRAVLKVQDGCNQFCSYCIIPYARGRIRSRSISDTVLEAKRLVAAGFSELVLTGIHLASWGKDSGEGTLLTLLYALSEIDGLERIRLGSLEPTLCDDAFVSGAASLPKVCHHFHLSLQSGCDKTLRRMNRKYTAEDYRQAVMRIRALMPDAAITTDVIVGFPQETEAEFAETFRFLEDISLCDVHVFKFSPRKGTPAATMAGQVAPAVKEERSRRLIGQAAKKNEMFARGFLAKEEPVLFEQQVRPGVYEGKTTQYLTVHVASEQDLTGLIKPVCIRAYQDGVLTGTLL